MRTLRLTAAVAAAALVMGLSALAFPSTASASQAAPAVHNYYGAYALSYDGAYGYGKNFPTRAGAYRAAIHQCKVHSRVPGQCRRIGWVENGCAAMWYAVVNHHVDTRNGRKPHFGYARGKSQAIRKAREGHPGGTIRSFCTAR